MAAIYIKNRLPLPKSETKTPYEMVYDIKPSHVKSAVVMKDGHATVKMPLHGEPTMVFGADGSIVATRKDAFVDHWKKLP